MMKRMNIPKIAIGLTTAAFAGLAVAGSAGAAENMICGKRESIIDQLEVKYGETARVMGFSRGAGVVEVYANDQSGSWTILITNPSGMSCLMAAGEAFESMDFPKGEAPA